MPILISVIKGQPVSISLMLMEIACSKFGFLWTRPDFAKLEGRIPW